MNFQDQLTGMGDCKTSRVNEGYAALWAQARLSCATGNVCIFYNWNSLKTNFRSILDFPIHMICGESQGLCLVTDTHSSLLVSLFLICAECSVLWWLKMETWAISHCPIRALGILCTPQPIKALGVSHLASLMWDSWKWPFPHTGSSRPPESGSCTLLLLGSLRSKSSSKPYSQRCW